MGMSTGGNSGGVVADINTTPLIDVMLVLLIIFMITAPLLAHKITPDLPRGAAKPNEEKPDTITVAIEKSGQVYWNDNPVTSAQLERLFFDVYDSAARNNGVQAEVQIRGDRVLQYQTVREVLKLAKKQGVVKIGIITTPSGGGG
jgi:biopolymer transport protein ExbD